MGNKKQIRGFIYTWIGACLRENPAYKQVTKCVTSNGYMLENIDASGVWEVYIALRSQIVKQTFKYKK